MLCGLRARSRERPAGPGAHSCHGHRMHPRLRRPNLPSVQSQGKLRASRPLSPERRWDSNQGEDGEAEGGRGYLRVQTQREEAQLRAEAQHPCVSAPRPGARGWARPPRPPQGPCPPGACGTNQGWGSRAPPGLGPNRPGEPGRGSAASVGRARDDEMPPRSLEEGILQWLGGYTVWTEAGAHPCPLPRRPVMTHRRQQSHVERHGYDWEQQRAWSLWVRSPSPASAKRSCASRAASLARRHICTKPGS